MQNVTVIPNAKIKVSEKKNSAEGFAGKVIRQVSGMKNAHINMGIPRMTASALLAPTVRANHME